MEETAGGYGATWKPKVLAALSYFGVLCFVPLILNKDDEFVAFHAKQGLVLWVWAMAAFFFVYIPGLGHLLFKVSTFGVPAYSLVGLLAVATNKHWKLPGIYEIAAKF